MTVSGARDSGRRIISVGGGKGGVGKSLVVANLATMMARQRYRVIVLDADLGAPNLHSFFGIHRPAKTIGDFFRDRSARLVELALDTSIPGLQILCGTPEVLGAASPGRDAKLSLISQLNTLDCDCLIIDVGAGTDTNTLDFFNAADIRLVVLTPEITSIQNGYGFLKMALYRRLQRAIESTDSAGRLFALLGGRAFEIGSSMESIETFLSIVEGETPELLEPFRLLLREFNASIVGNMLSERREMDTIHAIKRVVEKHLSLEAEIPAVIWSDGRVRASLARGKPLALAENNDANINAFVKLSRVLLWKDLKPIRDLRRQITRMLSSADRSFAFGLAGIETDSGGSSPATTERNGADAFRAELDGVCRASPRRQVDLRIQVQFHNIWHLGKMTDVSETSACLQGIRASASWGNAEGLLRPIGGSLELPVVLHSYNEATGRMIVRFAEPLPSATLDRLLPVAAAR
jgi:flagellar biosynthesis protein FlhG